MLVDRMLMPLTELSPGAEFYPECGSKAACSVRPGASPVVNW